MPFIVATYVSASSQGQRTHSAQTNGFPCDEIVANFGWLKDIAKGNSSKQKKGYHLGDSQQIIFDLYGLIQLIFGS